MSVTTASPPRSSICTPSTSSSAAQTRVAGTTIRFGIPMGCWRSLDGKCGENNQTDPDIRVANAPDVMAAGRDQQLEAAVNELMKKRSRTSEAEPK